MEQNNLNDIFNAFHKWYYNTHVWTRVKFLGIECQKFVGDMWNYQEIIVELKPGLVIEFGTAKGGSALFFSTILKNINANSKVLTVDINRQAINSKIRKNKHIDLLITSTEKPIIKEKIAKLRKKYKGKMFIILDSDHKKEHVLKEMEIIRDVTKPGDYLIVEDSNINNHPVLPESGEGPMEAINDYFIKYPHDYIHDYEREKKFGFTFAPNGYLIRK